MTFPNLFIGTPTHSCKEYCADRFVDAVLKHAPGAFICVLCNSRLDARGYDVPGVYYDHIGRNHLVPPVLDDSHYHTKEAVHKRIAKTCNMLREAFLEAEAFDLYLSLESDVILAADTLPRMLEAISDDYPIVYANCYRWPSGRPFLEYTANGPTDRITMGCTLMKRKVLEKIEFRYDPELLAAFPDAHFAYDCRLHGFGMWYDPTIYVEHVEGGKGRRGWGEIPKDELPRVKE